MVVSMQVGFSQARQFEISRSRLSQFSEGLKTLRKGNGGAADWLQGPTTRGHLEWNGPDGLAASCRLALGKLQRWQHRLQPINDHGRVLTEKIHFSTAGTGIRLSTQYGLANLWCGPLACLAFCV